jgi:hypothetical protein
MRANRIIIPVLLFIVAACQPVELDNGYQQTLAEGKLTVNDLATNDVLTLMIPGRDDNNWDYTGQKGALTGTGSIEGTFDYATSTVTITDISGTVVTTTGTASFENEQSIYRFNFNQSVKWFSVSSNRNLLVTSRSYSGGWGSDYGSLSIDLATAATSPYITYGRNSPRTQGVSL